MRSKGWLPAHNMDWQGIWCATALLLQAFLEIIASVFTAPFCNRKEVPLVTCMQTTNNTTLLKGMPSLKFYNPTWWASGPFAQTVINGIRSVNNSIGYHREHVIMRDGVAVALDWKTLDPLLSPEAPLIFLCHGLGGNSTGSTCNNATELLARKNWWVVVYNRRGHGGTSLLAAYQQQQEDNVINSIKAFPSHVDLDDMKRVVSHVVSKYPKAPKAIVGFSAGSNLVVRFQGDCADESPFMAAISVSNGHDLSYLTKTLKKNSVLPDLMLITFMKCVLYDRFEEVQQLAQTAGLQVDWERVLSACHARDFESLLTAPVWGFKDVDAYYRENSCFQSLSKVKVPLLSLANQDDPIIDKSLIRFAQEAAKSNHNIISVATVQGGHLGWMQGARAHPWMHSVLVEFLSTAFSLSKSM